MGKHVRGFLIFGEFTGVLCPLVPPVAEPMDSPIGDYRESSVHRPLLLRYMAEWCVHGFLFLGNI